LPPADKIKGQHNVSVLLAVDLSGQPHVDKLAADAPTRFLVTMPGAIPGGSIAESTRRAGARLGTLKCLATST